MENTEPIQTENLNTIQPAETPTKEEISAFVGDGALYYFNAWQPVLTGQSNGTGFNRAAFLMTGFWLPFRKMYGATLIYFGVLLLSSFLQDILFLQRTDDAQATEVFLIVTGVIEGTICGVYGNSWYLSHMKKAVLALRSQGLEKEDYLRRLSYRGGTSIVGPLVILILIWVIYTYT